MKKPSKAAYRKLPRFLWKRGELKPLSDDSKLVYLFLLAHPELTDVGTLVLSLQEIADELAWPLKRLQAVLASPWMQQEVYGDEHTGLIWLPRVLRYRPPQSYGGLNAWWKALLHLPSCLLQQKIFSAIRSLMEQIPEELHDDLLPRLEWFEAKPNH